MQGITRPATGEPTQDFPKCQDPAVVLRGEAPSGYSKLLPEDPSSADLFCREAPLKMKADHTFEMQFAGSWTMSTGSEQLSIDVVETYAGSWAVVGGEIKFSGTVDIDAEYSDRSQQPFQFSSPVDQLFLLGVINVPRNRQVKVLECNY